MGADGATAGTGAAVAPAVPGPHTPASIAALAVGRTSSPSQKGTTSAVDITRSTIPGVGHTHDCRTRGGQRFAVLVERTGRRRLLTYGPGGGDDVARDDGRPQQEIALDADEADLLADLLHQRSVADRLAELERRVAELAANPANRGIGA